MDEKLSKSIERAITISKVFIVWNVGFFLLSLFLMHTMSDDAAGSVLIRGGVYALGGLILIYLLRQMKQGKRSGWLRLSIISVLAPLGVIAFVLFTPELPVWFIAEHLISGLLLASVAFIVLSGDVRHKYPKTPGVKSN